MRNGSLHGGGYSSSTNFARGAQQVEFRLALDQAQLPSKTVGLDEAVMGEAHAELAAPPPSKHLPAEQRNVGAGGNRLCHCHRERFDQILGVADTVSSRLWVLHLGHVHQQSPRAVHGEHEGGVTMRAPAPWLVGDERLVGVEAGEVVDVSVVILGGTPAGPGDEGGEATLLGEFAGSRLASVVFGALDPQSSSHLCSSCCVVLAYDAVLPSLTGSYLPGAV